MKKRIGIVLLAAAIGMVSGVSSPAEEIYGEGAAQETSSLEVLLTDGTTGADVRQQETFGETGDVSEAGESRGAETGENAGEVQTDETQTREEQPAQELFGLSETAEDPAGASPEEESAEEPVPVLTESIPETVWVDSQDILSAGELSEAEELLRAGEAELLTKTEEMANGGKTLDPDAYDVYWNRDFYSYDAYLREGIRYGFQNSSVGSYEKEWFFVFFPYEEGDYTFLVSHPAQQFEWGIMSRNLVQVHRREYGQVERAAFLKYDRTQKIHALPDATGVSEYVTAEYTFHAKVGEAYGFTLWAYNNNAYNYCIVTRKHEHQWVSAGDGVQNTQGSGSALSCVRYETCEICGLERDRIEHSFGAWKLTGPAEDGSGCAQERSCVRCGEKETRTVAHDWEKKKVLKKANFKEDGLIADVCRNCGALKNQVPILHPAVLKLIKTSYTYNGNKRKPAVIIQDAKGNNYPDSMYTVAYSATSMEIGTHGVKVTLKGNAEGSTILKYKVTKIRQKLTLSGNSVRINSDPLQLQAKMVSGNRSARITYTGDNPSVAAVSKSGLLIVKNVGTVRITASVNGNEYYEPASVKAAIKVVPRQTVLDNIYNSVPGAWRVIIRQVEDVDNYHLLYADNPEFKNARSITLRTGIHSYTRTGMEVGKTYYVKAKTSKVGADGVRYYSFWSGSKKVTITK